MISLIRTKKPRQNSLAHNQFFENLRKKEFQRLNKTGHTYLDYTGGGLYAESQIKSQQKELLQEVFGNPHSSNPTSHLATERVAKARKAVIDFFQADDYHCIFTQNASGALKIIGECYPFTPNSQYLLLSDNHNSVNGIREYAKMKGAGFEYAPLHAHNLTINEEKLMTCLTSNSNGGNRLFAYPAQSNVSGVKHDLSWVKKAQENGWDVLLDAAAFVPTNRLNLSEVQPDFVSLSFYKIFGYPTGLGCLLVKKSKFNKLSKPWFAGGTVTLASVASPHHFLADDYHKFENGTINYLHIPAIETGLSFMNSVGMERISNRIDSLTHYFIDRVKEIQYDNGKPVVQIFGPEDRSNCGGTIMFTVLKSKGGVVDIEEVEQMANKRKISIRTGCFCNPGIDEINNHIEKKQIKEYFTNRSKGDYYDMISFMNRMRGAIRVSVGVPTTKADLDQFINLLHDLKLKYQYS